MKTSPSSLHALIASPINAPAFVGLLTEPSWPPFIRLCGESSDRDVALVVAQLARYGHGGDGPVDLASLTLDFPSVTPGGLLAIDELQEVAPSCCCGLEGWREWQRLLTGGDPPWLGHDPSPWVESRDDEFLVWPNGGLGEALPENAQPIRFQRSRLAEALVDVERNLHGFVGRLREWAPPKHA